MNIIKKNPFRILGVTANASERTIQKQISIIKRYSEIGKTPILEYDFEFIGPINRNQEIIKNAAGKIEQDYNKLLYALFWFVKISNFDEIALNYLKDNNIQKAIEIWEKTIKDDITERNFSSYQNLSSLYLALSLNENTDIDNYLKRGIILKNKLLHSDKITILVSTIIANNKINLLNLEKDFLDEILQLIKNTKNKLPEKSIIELFDKCVPSTQKYVIDKFTETPLTNTENAISNAIQLRVKNKRAANEYGEILYKKTINHINLLKNILGVDNYQVNIIINKLANEILQCAIVFFNSKIDDYDYNPAADALKIAEYAKSLGATGQVKLRIDENIRIIRNWLPVKKSSANINRRSSKREKTKSGLSTAVAWFILGIFAVILIIVGNKSSNPNTKKIYDNNNNPKREYVNPKSYNYEIESKYKGNSLKNGTSPYQKYYGRGVYSKNHENSILFKNGYKTDAIVFLIEYYSHKIIRHEYIKAGTNFKMTNIPTGYYYIKVYSGKDWNPYKSINNGKLIGGFDTNVHFYKSNDRPIHLLDDGKKYSVNTITLYTVQDGNMRTTPISENNFFN